MFMIGRTCHAMARSSITDDNVSPLIQLGIDMSTKMVDMSNMFLYTFLQGHSNVRCQQSLMKKCKLTCNRVMCKVKKTKP